MPTFQYKAVDNRTGEIVKNTVKGIANKKELYNKLKSNNLMPIDITATFELNPTQNSEEKKFKSYDNVIEFTHSLLILKKAGAEDVDAIAAIIRETENEQFKEILKQVLEKIESGEYIYSAMENYPKTFPATYTNIIKIGEFSDSLVNSLEQAIKYLAKEEKRIKKVKNTIKPKIYQLIGIFLLLLIESLIFMPIIQYIFNSVSNKIELNGAIIMINRISIILCIIISIIDVTVSLILMKIHKIKNNYKFDLYKYQSKTFGKLFYTIDFAKVMNSLSISLKNGMNIHEALEESKNIVENKVMKEILENAIEKCGEKTDSWTQAFENIEFGSSVLSEMLKLGVKTDLISQLDKTLEVAELDIDKCLKNIDKVLAKAVILTSAVTIIIFTMMFFTPAMLTYLQCIKI